MQERLLFRIEFSGKSLEFSHGSDRGDAQFHSLCGGSGAKMFCRLKVSPTPSWDTPSMNIFVFAAESVERHRKVGPHTARFAEFQSQCLCQHVRDCLGRIDLSVGPDYEYIVCRTSTPGCSPHRIFRQQQRRPAAESAEVWRLKWSPLPMNTPFTAWHKRTPEDRNGGTFTDLHTVFSKKCRLEPSSSNRHFLLSDQDLHRLLSLYPHPFSLYLHSLLPGIHTILSVHLQSLFLYLHSLLPCIRIFFSLHPHSLSPTASTAVPDFMAYSAETFTGNAEERLHEALTIPPDTGARCVSHRGNVSA